MRARAYGHLFLFFFFHLLPFFGLLIRLSSTLRDNGSYRGRRTARHKGYTSVGRTYLHGRFATNGTPIRGRGRMAWSMRKPASYDGGRPAASPTPSPGVAGGAAAACCPRAASETIGAVFGTAASYVGSPWLGRVSGCGLCLPQRKCTPRTQRTEERGKHRWRSCPRGGIGCMRTGKMKLSHMAGS